MLPRSARHLISLDLARRSLVIGLLKVAAGTSTVIVSLILARLLDTADFGRYFLVVSIVTVVSTLALVGLDQSAVRLLSATTEQLRRSVWAAHAKLLAPLSVVVATATFLLLPVISGSQDLAVPASVSAVIAIWLMAAVWQRFAAESLRGNQKVVLATLFGGLRNNGVLIGIGSVVAFLACWGLGLIALHHIIAASAAVTSILAIVSLWLVGRTLPVSSSSSYWVRSVVKSALPLAGVTILTTSRTSLDLWILAAVQDPAEVGLLAAATRLVPLVIMPKMVVNGVLAPLINPRHQQGGRALEDTIRSFASLATVPSLLVSLALVARPGWLLASLFGDAYSAAGLALILLTFAQLANVVAGSNSLTLMMLGRASVVVRQLLLILPLFLFLGFWWGRLYSLNGVAAALLVSNLLYNLLQTLAVRRDFGIWTVPTLSPDTLRSGLSTDNAAQESNSHST